MLIMFLLTMPSSGPQFVDNRPDQLFSPMHKFILNCPWMVNLQLIMQILFSFYRNRVISLGEKSIILFQLTWAGINHSIIPSDGKPIESYTDFQCWC
jgi:hypothetical protein